MHCTYLLLDGRGKADLPKHKQRACFGPVAGGAVRLGHAAAATVPRSFTEVGGLMSYSFAESEALRRSAFFVIKVLQGEKPADIPVEQPSKFELAINLKTAKALDLPIAEAFLLRADRVIE